MQNRSGSIPYLVKPDYLRAFLAAGIARLFPPLRSFPGMRLEGVTAGVIRCLPRCLRKFCSTYKKKRIQAWRKDDGATSATEPSPLWSKVFMSKTNWLQQVPSRKA
jgi:hypothetical protein